MRFAIFALLAAAACGAPEAPESSQSADDKEDGLRPKKPVRPVEGEPAGRHCYCDAAINWAFKCEEGSPHLPKGNTVVGIHYWNGHFGSSCRADYQPKPQHRPELSCNSDAECETKCLEPLHASPYWTSCVTMMLDAGCNVADDLEKVFTHTCVR